MNINDIPDLENLDYIRSGDIRFYHIALIIVAAIKHNTTGIVFYFDHANNSWRTDIGTNGLCYELPMLEPPDGHNLYNYMEILCHETATPFGLDGIGGFTAFRVGELLFCVCFSFDHSRPKEMVTLHLLYDDEIAKRLAIVYELYRDL